MAILFPRLAKRWLIAWPMPEAPPWTVLSAHLDTEQILDVIFTAGSYTALAWMVRSLGIALDDDLREALADPSAQ
jgi:hypothetical protein